MYRSPYSHGHHHRCCQPWAPLSPDEVLLKGNAEKTEEELEEEDSEELYTTLLERLWGLTEMFLEKIGSAGRATFDLSLFVTQKKCTGFRGQPSGLGQLPSWSCFFLLSGRLRSCKQQQQQLQQQQVLLGPTTGLSGGMPGALPSLPGKI